MNNYRILTDADVRENLSMDKAIDLMEDAFRAKSNGNLLSPPRYAVSSAKGGLVFTIGALTGESGLIGFRVYDTFPPSSTSPDQAQIVAVYEYGSGRFKGLVIGRQLGTMRTGAIGGVAMKHLCLEDAATLAIIGAGFQARTQVEAALCVRSFRRVVLFNRTKHRAERFAVEIAEAHGIEVSVADTARSAVAEAEAVICATKSPKPVLDKRWLKPGCYLSTIGPKYADIHELPPDIAEISDIIATDSRDQALDFENGFLIDDIDQVVGLDEIVQGRRPDSSKTSDINLFISVGLSGTEVILANYLLEVVGHSA